MILAGTATLVTGPVLAYGQTELERLLASTTLCVLGTLTALVARSTEASAEVATALLLVHPLQKAALFLGVGAIDHEAGGLCGETGHGDRLRLDSLSLVAAGLFVALASGVPPLLRAWPFVTGLWLKLPLPVVGSVGSPVVFAVGFYFDVLGIVLAILFGLAEEEP